MNDMYDYDGEERLRKRDLWHIRWERFWECFGFHLTRAPFTQGIWEGDREIMVDSVIVLSWLGRMRMLVSGKLHVAYGFRVNEKKEYGNGVFTFSILAPNFRARKLKDIK